MAVMKQAATTQEKARLRAEVIMKVRCGLMTAQQAAEYLGVSRKTYYKWEQRGLPRCYRVLRIRRVAGLASRWTQRSKLWSGSWSRPTGSVPFCSTRWR
jgi:excisionase family DNA binding protein